MSITAAHATTLIDNLRTNLINAQDTISQIITTRAWEPLGYATFSAMWDDKLHDIELTGAMKAHVIYEMFREGESDIDVATTLKGVGPKIVAAYRDAYHAGLPADQADDHARLVRVRAHTRALPGKRHSITIDGFTAEELAEINNLAIKMGTTRNALIRDAIRAGVKSWGALRADS